MRKLVLALALVLAFADQRISIRIAPPPPSEPPPPSGQTVLQGSTDITELGHFNLTYSNADRAQALALRYVDGDLRLLRRSSGSAHDIHEFSLSGKSFGDSITTFTNTWSPIGCTADTDFTPDEPLQFVELWFYDNDQTTLWSTSGTDYSDKTVQVHICRRTLDATGGTVSNFAGPVGMAGFTGKRYQKGMQAVPAAYAAEHGTSGFIVFGGGYVSLFAQGGGSALGLSAAFTLDPTGYADNTEIAAGDIDEVVDHYTASNGSGAGSPVGFDRARRIAGRATNYFDANDIRPNPITHFGFVNTSGTTVTWVSSTVSGNPKTFAHPGLQRAAGSGVTDSWWEIDSQTIRINGVNYGIVSVDSSTQVTIATSAGTQTNVAFTGPSPRPAHAQDNFNWQNMADGFDRIYWGDTMANPVWFTGTNKHGIIVPWMLGCGFLYYADAGVKHDSRCGEMHIYDPADLAASFDGTVEAHQVQPDNMTEWTFSGNVNCNVQRWPALSQAIDTTVSPARLYIVGKFHNSCTTSRLYVYEINDDAPPVPAPLWPIMLIGALGIPTILRRPRADVR